jgi:hypothetical protein
MSVFGGEVTRRHFVLTAAAVTGRANAPARLVVPIHRIVDSRARCSPEQRRQFWSVVWPEAVRNFSQGGIGLQTSDGPGEVRRSPGDMPLFIGLRRGVINLVLTDHIPTKWDNGRALAGQPLTSETIGDQSCGFLASHTLAMTVIVPCKPVPCPVL